MWYDWFMGWSLFPELNAPEKQGTARFSADTRHRYDLTRSWGPGPVLCVVMLNPSTATEDTNDPTIRRVTRFAAGWGFMVLHVVNLFALRSTDPSLLLTAEDPVGPDNDAALRTAATGADEVLCAWGHAGIIRHRSREVVALLRETGKPLTCLGMCANGEPKHPLYVPANTVRTPYERE